MTGLPTISNDQWERLKRMIEGQIAGLNEIGLSDLCRRLDTVDEANPDREKRLGNLINLRLASAILRVLGWRKMGTMGTGYDRQPFYVPRRPAERI